MTRPPEQQLNMENYKITERKGHHQPNSQGYGHGCGCGASTSSGYAYRDKVAKATNEQAEWEKIRFYHQSPVVKINYGVKWLVDTHGYGNHPTTRERINKDLPTGFKIVQRDYEVKLQLPNGDSIELPTEKFTVDYRNNQVITPSGEVLVDYEPRKVEA